MRWSVCLQFVWSMRMRRVKAGGFLKSIELILENQRHLAQQTELVGRGDDYNAARFDHARKLPHERAGVLQVFDGLDRGDHIRIFVGQRQCAVVQIAGY